MDINRIMKTLYSSLLLLLCGMSSIAQTVMDGKVTVSDLAVSRSKDKLFVALNIDVSALEIKSNREIILTPSLFTAADNLSLPSVTVAGRNRYYHHLRNDSFSGDRRLYRQGDVSVIEYRTVVPYQKWMNTAVVRIGNETCGCCSETLSQGAEQLAVLHLEPKAFVPAFVYIRPKAEPKINVIKGSAYIDFPVNRTEIHENYRRNPIELQKIRATIDAVRNDADTRITALTIKGYASPEGSYINNIRLAKGRTATLKEYVKQQYNFPDSLLATSFEPEDWEGLERFVETSDLVNREGILDLIHTNLDPDVKDRKIKSAYPADYAYLLQHVYPALRHSDYTVTYVVRAYSDIEEIKRLLKTAPQKLSLQEMYRAAQEMTLGSDEYNETFDIAVRMFPEDRVANLNAANAAMSRGDMKSAERYLAKAGDTPQAIYARGVYAALKGQYEQAGKLFDEAARNGLTEATQALRQLEEIIN